MRALNADPASLRAGLCSRPEFMCNANGDITAFALLGDKALSCGGQWPSGISSLPMLLWLQISGANLGARIADVFSSLAGSANSLQHLILPDSNIGGDAALAGSAGACGVSGQLSRLVLAGNALRGAAPACWAQPNLRELDLSSNSALAGMPTGDWAAAAPGVRVLDLSATAVAGTLTSFPTFAMLFNASGTNLTGGLPALPRNLRLLVRAVVTLMHACMGHQPFASACGEGALRRGVASCAA